MGAAIFACQVAGDRERVPDRPAWRLADGIAHGNSGLRRRSVEPLAGEVGQSIRRHNFIDRGRRASGRPFAFPDGRTLAVQGGEGSKGLWVYDLNSGIKSRVGVESVVAPQIAWTPSGSEITFAANRAGSLDIFSKSVGSDEEPTLLVGTPMNEFAPDWSPGQKILIYTAGSPGINRQLLYRERRENGSLGEAAVFLKTSFNESMPRFSPDGHFVAYVSDESGSNEVYVREFPTGANKRRISPNGGTLPRWSRTGKEIYYMGERRLFAAGVTMSPEHSSVPAMPLFERRSLSAAFDVSGDGKQFVIMDRPAGEPPLSIHVVHNWYSEFRGQHSEPAK